MKNDLAINNIIAIYFLILNFSFKCSFEHTIVSAVASDSIFLNIMIIDHHYEVWQETYYATKKTF